MENEIKFKFWKENKVANLFQLSESELVNAFKEWLPKRKQEWIAFYGTEIIINDFISSKDGLNSVTELDALDLIYDLLKPILLDYERKIEPDTDPYFDECKNDDKRHYPND